jgi:hypothetical protein
MKFLAAYFRNLTTGRIILWCYLIWYLVVLVRYFDSSPRIWLTSLGLAAIVGTALFISSTAHGNKLERWQIIRLFLMPFFVSSFAALVKGKQFVLIFSPNPKEILLALGICALFCVTVWLLKKTSKSQQRSASPSAETTSPSPPGKGPG